MPLDHDHPVDPARVRAARAALADAEHVPSLAHLLTLLGEPIRQRLIRALLSVPELCVGDLALALEVSEDSVTYAVRVLRDAGLIERRRDGRYHFYRLSDTRRETLAAAITQLDALLFES